MTDNFVGRRHRARKASGAAADNCVRFKTFLRGESLMKGSFIFMARLFGVIGIVLAFLSAAAPVVQASARELGRPQLLRTKSRRTSSPTPTPTPTHTPTPKPTLTPTPKPTSSGTPA